MATIQPRRGHARSDKLAANHADAALKPSPAKARLVGLLASGMAIERGLGGTVL
jgi:hypothetical protein